MTPLVKLCNVLTTSGTGMSDPITREDEAFENIAAGKIER